MNRESFITWEEVDNRVCCDDCCFWQEIQRNCTHRNHKGGKFLTKRRCSGFLLLTRKSERNEYSFGGKNNAAPKEDKQVSREDKHVSDYQEYSNKGFSVTDKMINKLNKLLDD